jgi:hypothetical protein
MGSRIAIGSLVTLLTLAMAPEAHARHRELGVELTHLEGRVGPRRIVVEYRITGASWSEMRHRGIQPRLTLLLEGDDRGPPWHQSHTHTLHRPEGRVRFPAPNGHFRGTVRFAGHAGNDYVSFMRVAGIRLRAAELVFVPHRASEPRPRPGRPIARPPSGPKPRPGVPVDPRPSRPRPIDPDLIGACGDAFMGDRAEQRCLQAAKPYAYNRVSLVRACESAMGGDTSELECIEAARNAQYPMPSAIAACEEAMGGDSLELSCIKLVARARRDPTDLIRACSDSMSGDRSELNCIRESNRVPGH